MLYKDYYNENNDTNKKNERTKNKVRRKTNEYASEKCRGIT
jgi:hypothetical protein